MIFYNMSDVFIHDTKKATTGLARMSLPMYLLNLLSLVSFAVKIRFKQNGTLFLLTKMNLIENSSLLN